jgi:hypothetical protein
VNGNLGVEPELALVKKSSARHIDDSRRQTPGRLSLAGQLVAVLLELIKKMKLVEIKRDIKNNFINFWLFLSNLIITIHAIFNQKFSKN